MRWIALILAVLLAATALLFGGGYLFLPSKMVVSQSVEIARPRAAVFALLDNLHTFNEWSPWSAADPNAVYTFEGESGAGQTAVWETKGGRIGSGRQTIVRSLLNQRVDTLLDLGPRGSTNIAWIVDRQPHGSKVTWRMVSNCTPSPLRVPCRYMNLITRSAIEKDFETGLKRLKALAEELPGVDFEPLQPEFIQARPMSYVFVQNDVLREPPPKDATPEALAQSEELYGQHVATAIAQSLGAAAARIQQAGATLAGPPVMVTVSADEDHLVFRAGYPFTGAPPPEGGGVSVGQTPAGKALKFVHVGSLQAMRQTYVMIGAYLEAHRLQADGGAWEVHVKPDGEPAQQRREIYIPLK